MSRGDQANSGGQIDHVVDWIFDLDNTLYPASCKLFTQIDRRMGEFIGRRLGIDIPEARLVQKRFFHQYGSTMRGLMIQHGVDPTEFLDYAHNIDITRLPPSPALDSALDRLEGRKFIFTNATVRHAENVVERLGVGRHFDHIFDIAAADFLPKPEPATYRAMVRRCGVAPKRAALFEDIARNLKPAAALGITTIWVRSDNPWASAGIDAGNDHVHHVADDLVTWLENTATTNRQESAS